MNPQSFLYPSEELQARLRALGVKSDLDLAMLGELLPVGTQSARSDGFWYCLNNHGYFKADKEVDARAMLLIFLLEQEYIKFS